MPAPTPRRKRSARSTEIATAAGVSESTVDRVLNERGSVSDTARRKVIDAARSLGIPRVLPTVAHGVLRFDVVLGYERDNDYYQNLDAAVQRYARLLGSRIAVHRHHWPYEQEGEMLDFIQRRSLQAAWVAHSGRRHAGYSCRVAGSAAPRRAGGDRNQRYQRP